MTKKNVDQKPSETALFAALRRTLAHKEFNNENFGPDHLAEHFLPPHFRFFLKFKKIQANTKDKLNGLLPGLNEYMIARTVYFDRLFTDALNRQIPQIVLLGAGYDSRAYRFRNLNRDTKIFELDIAPTQERKKKCLKKAKIDIPRHVSLIPIDFNKDALIDVLEKGGYQGNAQTLFIWEGVSYYLEAESVDATLKFVSQASHDESTIAFDYTVTVSEETIDDYYGVKEFSETMKKHHANEDLLFSLDEGETAAFLKQKGLKMVNHMDNETIEKTFLLDESGSLIGRVTGHFRFVVASPEK